MFQTGYFANVGDKVFVVHLLRDGKPVCGARPKGDFQWCARRCVYDYLSCNQCKKWVDARRDNLGKAII
jgi:hypothetical protein